MTRKITVEIIVFLYILLFVYAALTKLMDFHKFSVQLGQSPMLTNYAGLLSWSVPAAELAISILLILPVTRLAGLYAAFSLMVMFTAYIILASNFSDYVPCSCGGVIESMSWTEHLIFNSAFLLMAVTAALLHVRNTKSSLPHRTPRRGSNITTTP